MSEPRDDELATMLKERADRVQASAGREVLAAVRDEMRAPTGGAGFALLPVVSGRGINGAAGWAAIGLVAVLVLAVMGGRLSTNTAQPSSRVAASAGLGVPSVAAASAVPATQVAASPAIPMVTMDQLRARLADGTLDGRTVLVTGRLDLLPLPCPNPMPPDCYGLQLHGLSGVEVTHAGVMTVSEAFATIRGDAGDRPMAFRVEGRRLAFLGWVTRSADGPLAVHQLLELPPATGPAELAVVGGWLLGGLPSLSSCPSARASPCLDTRPVLADASPRPDGQPTTGDATEVTVDDSLGLAQAPATIAGPFLVRYLARPGGGDLPPWRVVAGLDPAKTVQVNTAAASAAMTPELLRAAITDGSLDGRLVEITGYLQPSGGSCPADVPQPCSPYVVLGLDGIPVTWDGPLGSVRRVADGTSPPAPTESTLVVTPRDGRLVLLGRLARLLERPAALTDLLYRRGLSRLDDPFALSPVSGWLVVGGIHSCPMLGPDATPCPGPPPTLTGTKPFPDGMMTSDAQAQVEVWPDAVGIDQAAVVTPGPFLVRDVINSPCSSSAVLCAGGPTSSWEIVARYDAGSVYQLVVR